jgi:transcription elongation factor GreA
MLNKLKDQQHEMIEMIKKKQWARVEALWLDMMEANPPECPEFFEFIAATIARNGGAKRLPDLWELLLNYFYAKGKHVYVLTLAKYCLRYTPDAPSLHPAVSRSFLEVNKDCEKLDLYMKKSQLRDKFNLGESLARCEEFIKFDEGEMFQHITWGVGTVVELDITQKKVKIDFPRIKNKMFTFEGVHQYLTKLFHGHFLALEETNVEKLQEMAEKEPVELIKVVLKSFGNKIKQADLKANLIRKVINPKKFATWWNKTKKQLRDDPWVELGSGARPIIILREKSKDYFEETLERFDKAHTLVDKRIILKEIVQHQNGQSLPLDKATPFAARVRKWHSTYKEFDIHSRMQMIYLMDEVASLMPSMPAPLDDNEDAILEMVKDFPEFLYNLEIHDYQCKALDRLIEIYPDDILSNIEMAYLDGPAKLSQYAFQKFLQKEEYKVAEKAIRKLLGHFDRNPESYAWTVRQILKKRWKNIRTSKTDYIILTEALHNLERTRQKYIQESPNAKANRDLQSQLRSLITGDKFALLITILDEIPTSEVKIFHNSLQTSPAFIASVKEAIDNIFRKVRKDIFEDDVEESKPKVHYCTEEMLKIKQDELRKIKTVEIPRNTKDIATARAHGDLSENAEYDAAKDRQGMLFTMMEKLQDLISRARILKKKGIRTSQISIGTRFGTTNLTTGEKETFILLGIWEADPDKNIISYFSPIGQVFLGKKTGEICEVSLPNGGVGRYEVLSIESAF